MGEQRHHLVRLLTLCDQGTVCASMLLRFSQVSPALIPHIFREGVPAEESEGSS